MKRKVLPPFDKDRYIVNVVDPDLSFIRELGGSLSVCQVTFEGVLCVLKAAYKNYHWGEAHVRNEKRISDLANDISGFTHVIKRYEPNDLHGGAVLKEYFEGDTLPSIRRIEIITNIQNQIETTVRNFHSLGIANLDLQYKNIVLSLDKQEVKIVDIGTCNVYSNALRDVYFSQFRIKCREDLLSLEKMFG